MSAIKNTLLIIFICIAFASSNAIAGETVLIQKKLQWKDLELGSSREANILDFVDAMHIQANEFLPIFVYRQELKSFSIIQSVNWISTNPVSLDPRQVGFPDLNYVTTDWQIESEISDGGGTSYLVVKILPIRKSLSGGYERLLDLNLEVRLESAVKPAIRDLNFAENSVLSSGIWYKIAIANDGIYKIDRSFLSQLGINTDETLNPNNINIYGNGGQLLPMENSATRYDDLQKCAIYIEGEGDQNFGNSDFILFYGKGPDTWKATGAANSLPSRWVHDKHYYSDSAYYFIRTDDTNPSRIQNVNQSELAATHTINKFQDFQYKENDIYNLAKSGREFFGDQFDINTAANFPFNFPNISTTDPAFFETRCAIRSLGGGSSFKFSIGNSIVETETITTSDGVIAPFAAIRSRSLSFTPTTANTVVNVVFDKFNSNSTGWIDFVRMNVTRLMTMSGSQMKFRDTLSVGSGNVGLFQLASAGTVKEIWDISDYTQPTRVPFNLTGTSAEWKLTTNGLREFIAFLNSGYLVPTPKGAVVNQNLHALNDVDLVIISSPRLLSSAQEVAEIHAAEGQTVALITLPEIFNEFSSGNPDVTAPRMLMKMLYDRAAGDVQKMPKNLLLFGDGDYSANKGMAAQLGNNVMVFESDDSWGPTTSYVSDDYFVFLSDEDNGESANLLDAGVGRIPASNLSEAQSYVSKIRSYIAENTANDGGAACLGEAIASPFGNWRNTVVFVSDDQDGSGNGNEGIHLSQSDWLSDSIRANHPEYDIVKIYMDAFKQESTPGGERYSEGSESIKRRVENGALLVTYIGHGGERGWAHERVLTIPTIAGWTNKNKLPVFLTATCELARYDDPEFNTAGEILVMNPNGGAIAMLTTTRIVFSGDNYEMDLAFFKHALFDRDIPDLTLGKINQLTKNNVNDNNYSKPNFSLLGDPALKMVYPQFEVYTTQINGQALELFTDTLKALQEVEFSGFVGNSSGEKLTNFNGFIYPTVFDKQTVVFTQNNDGGGVQNYETFNKNIFRGKASVNQGDFKFKFIIPYDINYTVGPGRVSYYAVAGNQDAHGYSEDFKIGSSLNSAQLNTIGPEISLYMNDTTFISGGLTNVGPIFIGRLKDENGINTVGNGIGHDLTAVLDQNSSNPIVLNDYYTTDTDTYQSGEIRYQLNDLAPGDHNITLKAWDVHNNSSTSTLDFLVAENSQIALQHVLNYPNPFTTSTQFMFEHNQACELLDVRIQIFTVSGKLVKTILQNVHQDGFRSEPIAWDGLDDFGDRIGKGVYVYKLEVRNPEGAKAEQFEKLVILK